MSSHGLRQVAEYIPQRPMIRSVRNPLDKATIVSIFPHDIIKEKKETIQPAEFSIPGGTIAEPSVTIVGPASWWKDYDFEQPMLEIQVSAVALAHSLIFDYCVGMLGCDMETARPGLFFVPGEFTADEIKSRYKMELATTKVKQDNWFKILVRLGDSLWSRMNGNPLVIWDEMRLAARELGIDRPWLKDYQVAELVKCFACGSLRNPEYPICPNCKNVDMSHDRAKEIKISAS